MPSEALRARADAWFPFAGHLIDGLYHTARSIESTARQHGSLVTLGTLAAGLAHEINNPAAAASRSVDALGGANDALLASLANLADLGIHAAEFAALDELRREARPVTDDHDALALADREQELAVWMERHDVARAWELAPTLAVAGVDTAWCERAALVVPGPALGAGLAWASATFAVAALLAEVKESTRRISELVAAVRSYSQVDRATVQQVDLTDGIESTLVVLGHKLRGGVTVRREYAEDLPRIDAYPGELNQVWTNLVDNAVDAMDGDGTLTIVARGEGDHAVVEVRDTGAGMTDEVKARVFEAFFTTKEVGQRHRPRPRHRATDRGRAAPRRHRHRLASRCDRGPGAVAGPDGRPARVVRPRPLPREAWHARPGQSRGGIGSSGRTATASRSGWASTSAMAASEPGHHGVVAVDVGAGEPGPVLGPPGVRRPHGPLGTCLGGQVRQHPGRRLRGPRLPLHVERPLQLGQVGGEVHHPRHGHGEEQHEPTGDRRPSGPSATRWAGRGGPPTAHTSLRRACRCAARARRATLPATAGRGTRSAGRRAGRDGAARSRGRRSRAGRARRRCATTRGSARAARPRAARSVRGSGAVTSAA